MRSNKVTNGATGIQNGEIATSFIGDDFEQERAEMVKKILGNAVEIIRLLKQARMAVQEYQSMSIELDGIIREDSDG